MSSPSARAHTEPEDGVSSSSSSTAADVPAEPAAAKRAGVPGQPPREAIVDAMNAVLPALRSCAGGLHGNAVLQLTVRSEGFVSYALVGGDYSGTKEGSCIAQAVRQAKFPEFSDSVLRLTYPVRL